MFVVSARKVLTLHAPLALAVTGPIVEIMTDQLHDAGVEDVWVSLDDLPDVVVMAHLPDEVVGKHQPYAAVLAQAVIDQMRA